jgi:hypothetical protein
VVAEVIGPHVKRMTTATEAMFPSFSGRIAPALALKIIDLSDGRAHDADARMSSPACRRRAARQASAADAGCSARALSASFSRTLLSPEERWRKTLKRQGLTGGDDPWPRLFRGVFHRICG